MNGPLISVILPVYNVASLLPRCMESVVNQTYRNLQIILVDDGSKDESGQICDEWKERDPRVQVIHKENGGLGKARNTGLDHAVGEYIIFIDSDDYVETDMAEELLKTLQENHGQVCYGGCIDVDIQGNKRYGTPPEKRVYIGDEILREFLSEAIGRSPQITQNCYSGLSVWGNLYSTALLKENNIRFLREQDVLSEDIFFNLAVGMAAERIVVCPKCFYNYCVNTSSLTKRYRPDRFEAAINMRRVLRKTIDVSNNRYASLAQHIDRNYLTNCIDCIKQEVVYEKSNGHKHCMKQIRKMADSPVTCEVLAAYPINRMQANQRVLFSLLKAKFTLGIYWLFRLRYKI